MLHKPHWTQGLELGTHHFQWLDRYHESLIAHRIESLFDFTWGIHEIRWDSRAIAGGQVAITKLDAILPDGTPIALDVGAGDPVTSLTIPEMDKGNVLDVFIGIRKLHAGANVDAEAKGPERYVREKIVAPDFTGGTDPVRVEALRPNVQILFEGGALQDFVTLPCARVIRSPAGHLTFDDTFVPALLSVAASPYLRRELRTVLDGLSARQSLQGRTAARDATEIAQRWLGSIVGSFVPRVADLVHQRQVHPLAAYRILAELLGALAPFTRAGDQRVPPFQFDQLGAVFSEIFAGLASVLEALGAEQHRRIPLIRFDPTTLFADLNEPGVFRNDFFLRVVGSDTDELRGRAQNHFKLAAWTELPAAVSSATAGVPLRHDPRPPGSLPVASGAVYFKLEKGEAFSMVVKTGQLGIHHMLGLPFTEIALFVVEPGGVVTDSVSADRVDRAIAQIDGRLAGMVDAVLHDESFQALEAAWRGLASVVEQVQFTENIDVVVWSCSREEVAEDFADQADVTRTRFFRTVYTAEYGQHGGRPYAAILASWSASPTVAEMELLARVASVAAMAHAPLLLAASPELLGLRSFSELQAMTSPEAILDRPGAERWVHFRATEDSRYVGVLLPRVLMRLPYRESTHGATRFVYDERIAGGESYLWGSPIFAFAVRLAHTFARFRSYTGLLGTFEETPHVLDAHPSLGAGHIKPPVEVVLSRRLEQSLGELGFVPLTWDSARAALRVATANSAQVPRTFGSTEGGQAATLSHLLGTRLPYLLLASRFAHYLKVIERERIGAHRDAADVEQELNDWLSRYVVLNDSVSPATRLKYPLRNARVKVSDVEGAPGVHRMDVFLQPHLRYMRQAFTLSVSGRMEAR